MVRLRQRLSLPAIARETGVVWRRAAIPLTILAAVVEVPLVLVEVAFHLDVSWRDLVDGDGLPSGALLVVVYGALSHHLMAGLIEGLVAAEREGVAHPRLAVVLRDLPWARLLVADLLLAALAIAGLLALVVPGLLVLTWFSIVAPLINLERQGVLASFRRSFRLVQGHSIPVAVVALSTFAGPELVVAAVSTATHTGNVTVDAVAHAVPAIVLLPLAALPLVVLTFDLVALDARRRGLDPG